MISDAELNISFYELNFHNLKATITDSIFHLILPIEGLVCASWRRHQNLRKGLVVSRGSAGSCQVASSGLHRIEPRGVHMGRDETVQGIRKVPVTEKEALKI